MELKERSRSKITLGFLPDKLEAKEMSRAMIRSDKRNKGDRTGC